MIQLFSKRNLVFLLQFIFLLTIRLQVIGQPLKFHVSTERTSLGIKIIYANNFNSFSVNVDEKNIKNLPSEGEQHYISVDGSILQYLLVPPPEKVNYDELNEKTKKDFLIQYENYEMQSIKSSLGLSELNEKLQFATLDGKLNLFWVFDMPKQYKDIRQQCYLVTVCFDHVLVFNCPVTIRETMLGKRAYLLKIAKSLKITRL